MIRHTIDAVEVRIVEARDALDEFAAIGLGIIDALKINHVVMNWVMTRSPHDFKRIGGQKCATAKNVALLDPLWSLCAAHGIALGIDQKIDLFQDFLDD